MALPMNVSGLRRNIKNIAHNYTDAQVKVREATSNDPWGPSSTIMSEIADLTYNVVAFSEIMQMVWKRLNDHGKNWRHVYKALVLLEYLIKTGSEKVAEQSRENIHSISTLKDFQYIEEGKDQGINVREKAKAMVALLKDDERLKNERVRALKAKERFAQSVSGMASDPDINSPTSPSYPGTLVTSSSRTERDSYGVRERPTDYGELESARPHTVGEEELQLQLALAMSKEEADHEEARRRSDDVRLQMALNESKDEKSDDGSLLERQARQEQKDRSGINDLLDINFNPPQNNGALLGAVGGLGLGSPLSPPSAARDPWGLSPPGPAGSADPQGSRKSPLPFPSSTSPSVPFSPNVLPSTSKVPSHNPFSTPPLPPPSSNTGASIAKPTSPSTTVGSYPSWDTFKEAPNDSKTSQVSLSSASNRASNTSTRPVSSFISSSWSAKEQVLSNPRFSLANPFLCDLLSEADEEPSTSESSIFESASNFSHVTHPNLIPPPRMAPSAPPKNNQTLPPSKKLPKSEPSSAWSAIEFQTTKSKAQNRSFQFSLPSSTVPTNISESFSSIIFTSPQSTSFPSSSSPPPFTEATRGEASPFVGVEAKVDPWGVAAPQPPAVSSPPLAAPPKVDPWGAAPSRAQASPAPVATTLAPDNDPWSPTPPAPPAALPPTATAANDPWAPVPAPAPASDPWAAVKSPSPLGAAQPDPFAPLPPQQPALDDFSVLTNREKPAANDAAFNLSGLDDALSSASRASPAKSRSPASFLGENSNLVNLDNLVASKSSAAGMGANPFSGSVMSGAVGGLGGAGGGASGIVPNPFQAAQSPKPSINQLRASAVGGFNDPWGAAPHNNGIDGLTSKGSDPF